MNEDMRLPRTIRVEIEERHPGLFLAISPDLKGLFVAKHSRIEARDAVPSQIENLHEACGTPVIVKCIVNDNDMNYHVSSAMADDQVDAALAAA